jgi:hypothetical protein
MSEILKPLPTNILKEHLLKAIEKIEKEGIPNNGDSSYYDVAHNGKYYPPKLIVSIANLFANGIELNRSSFDGGHNTPCFKLLKNNGFEIVTKEMDELTSVEELKKYVSHFKNDELLITFFELAKSVLGDIELSENDKKIAFTLRKNGKQISINLGRKLVLAIYKSKNQNFLCFYFEEKDVFWAKNLIGFVKEETFSTSPPAKLLYYLASKELLENQQLIQKVKHGIEEWFPSVDSAGQPERHNRLIYNLIMDTELRKKFFIHTPDSKDFHIQDIVYEDKPIDLIPAILDAVNSQEINQNSLETDFCFEKGRLAFNSVIQHNESKEFYSNLFDRFVLSKLPFTEFQESIKNELIESEFIDLVGKTIAYIDYNSANKNVLNEYSDKRTMAKSGVNQSLWLRGFLKLKIAENNPNHLPKNISNAFKYLINPSEGLTMLTPGHRVKVSKFILGQKTYIEDSFIIDLKTYFKKYPLTVKNDENFTRIISEILYLFPKVYKLWNPEGEDHVQDNDYIEEFITIASENNLYFSPFLAKRYVASLATKPFVIFTGLSGSGKTKLAQTFSKWICESEVQYKIIPVGADWTNREPLLGYPNSLDSTNYVLPDNGALALVIDACEEAKDKDLKSCKPYFLILDEMNLSHVERYFADFLSAMESKEPISLYKGENRSDSRGIVIPQQIVLPPNLFIVGTVNIDETTYMFSPKVLDRANTIEFRLDENDIRAFFERPGNLNSLTIDGEGSSFAKEFMEFVASEEKHEDSKNKEMLLVFFEELQKFGSEFGYRTAGEMLKLIQKLEHLELKTENKENTLDIAIMQKLLPKLNGSRSKLSKTLPVLASFCCKNQNIENAKLLLENFKSKKSLTKEESKQLLLPLSFEKIASMYSNALENGFASYAEG